MQVLLAIPVGVLYNAAGVTLQLEIMDLHRSKVSEEQEEQMPTGLEIGFGEVDLTYIVILYEFEHVAARKTSAERVDGWDYGSMDEAAELVLICKREVSRCLLVHIQGECSKSYFWIRMTKGWSGSGNWGLRGSCLPLWS